MRQDEKNLRELFQSKSKDWGNIECIHEGISYYFYKYYIMSGQKTDLQKIEKQFKTIYVEKGKGKIFYKSLMKNINKTIPVEDGFYMNLLPEDEYYIEAEKDLFIFECGTAKCNGK